MEATRQTLTRKIVIEKNTLKTVRNDSLSEEIMGASVIVLALLGLFDIMPRLMLPVSVIVMGAAFLLEGETVSLRVSRLLGKLSKDRLQEGQLGVGVTAEFFAAITGVVLGFLALLGMYSPVMVSIAVIVYGSALMWSSGLTAQLNDFETESSGEARCFRRIVCEAISSASGVDFLFGLVAGILGIIALTGMDAVRTSLAALFIIGASIFLNGTTIMARIRGRHIDR